jgi:phenylalanyl-tRNA synthetase alpha subunit
MARPRPPSASASSVSAFPLCARAWEVEVEWEDRWTGVAMWGKYNERALRVLGNETQEYGAVGVSFGLERLACLHYGIDDVRRIAASSQTPEARS